MQQSCPPYQCPLLPPLVWPPGSATPNFEHMKFLHRYSLGTSLIVLTNSLFHVRQRQNFINCFSQDSAIVALKPPTLNHISSGRNKFPDEGSYDAWKFHGD